MSTVTIEAKATKVQFLSDTIAGLKGEPKYMHSKYFYDERGDSIFQQIMNMEEYYLTDAEMDILSTQTEALSKVISAKGDAFDLIELGAGDATKSIHLLRTLIDQQLDFKYIPVDISEHVISLLEETLPVQLPDLNMEGLNGDYFEMLKNASEISDRRKVVLFMGANIGNMNMDDARKFCEKLKNQLTKDDLLIIGFDLKKNPNQILSAYNDQAGITRSFNMNLLTRINKELDGNFNLQNFEHYANYDPHTGACKSYLISLKNQQVNIGDESIKFEKNEYVFMEISQKYALSDIENLANSAGFVPVQNFFDKNKYFVDSVWAVGASPCERN